MALASYSRAYRVMLAIAESPGPRPPIIMTHGELPRSRSTRGLGPYDVLSPDDRGGVTVGRRSDSRARRAAMAADADPPLPD